MINKTKAILLHSSMAIIMSLILIPTGLYFYEYDQDLTRRDNFCVSQNYVDNRRHPESGDLTLTIDNKMYVNCFRYEITAVSMNGYTIIEVHHWIPYKEIDEQ